MNQHALAWDPPVLQDSLAKPSSARHSHPRNRPLSEVSGAETKRQWRLFFVSFLRIPGHDVEDVLHHRWAVLLLTWGHPM